MAPKTIDSCVCGFPLDDGLKNFIGNLFSKKKRYSSNIIGLCLMKWQGSKEGDKCFCLRWNIWQKKEEEAKSFGKTNFRISSVRFWWYVVYYEIEGRGSSGPKNVLDLPVFYPWCAQNIHSFQVFKNFSYSSISIIYFIFSKLQFIMNKNINKKKV